MNPYYIDNPYYNEGMGEGDYDNYADYEEDATWWQDSVNEKWQDMLSRKVEGRWQAVSCECGRPQSCIKRGTWKECCYAALAEELGYSTKYAREYLDVKIMEINVDECGDEESFGALRDEYDHCWEMGDFDEY